MVVSRECNPKIYIEFSPKYCRIPPPKTIRNIINSNNRRKCTYIIKQTSDLADIPIIYR